LLIDRPEVLRSARDVDVVDARPNQRGVERLAHLLDERFTLAALLRDFLRERAVLFGLEMLERQVLELPPHLRHTEAVSERRVEVARLLGDATTLLLRQVVERPHIVETVRKLHDDDARVLGNRE